MPKSRNNIPRVSHKSGYITRDIRVRETQQFLELQWIYANGY